MVEELTDSLMRTFSGEGSRPVGNQKNIKRIDEEAHA